MTDIVERLRYADWHSQQRILGSRIFEEAADEITRLREEAERLTRERDEWRSRQSETQEALQAIGEDFGAHGGECRTSAMRRLLVEATARAEAAEARAERLEKALEPNEDTKAAYMGEFSFQIIRYDGENDVAETVIVPWTTIKEIMKAIRARAPVRP